MANDYEIINKRGIVRKDGYAKATGSAVYCRDVQFPGMLYAKHLNSPYPNAVIKSMDTSKAEALPGVRYILRYDDPDIAGVVVGGQAESGIVTKPVSRVGTVGNPGDPLASWALAQAAYWEGQPVGCIVAADTVEIAEEALKLVEIDWEERAFELDEEVAAQPDSNRTRPEERPDDNITFPGRLPYSVDHGDVEEGFRQSDNIIEFKIKRGYHTWAGPEPKGDVARWTGDTMEIWEKCQAPWVDKWTVAEAFDMPVSKFKFNVPYQGGSYGGWSWIPYANIFPYTLALLAKRCQKPVKIIWDRSEDFYGGSMDDFTGYVKVGFNNDGKIIAVYTKTYQGNTAFWTLQHFMENTCIPNLYSDDIGVTVNRGMTTAVRCEQLMNTLTFSLVFDHVAAELGMDPTEVALINDGYEGHGMDYVDAKKEEYGYPLRDSLQECIDAGKAAIDWDNKWHAPSEKTLTDGRKHGMAFTWDHEWNSKPQGADCGIMMHHDGSASVLGEYADVGVNPESGICQVVAEEIGISYDKVNCRIAEDQGFVFMPPACSGAFTSNIAAARLAAQSCKAQLLERASSKMDLTADALDIKDNEIFEKANPDNKIAVAEAISEYIITHESRHFAPIFGWAFNTHEMYREIGSAAFLYGGVPEDPPMPRFQRQAEFIEVAVDTETGEIEVLSAACANDVGRAISPEACEGQQYGGMYMGVGRGKTEEVIICPTTGVKLNANLYEYKYATFNDIGPIACELVETAMGYGPYGNNGIGEDIATMSPPLIGQALYNATGVWVDDYPITPDKVLKALGKI